MADGSPELGQVDVLVASRLERTRVLSAGAVAALGAFVLVVGWFGGVDLVTRVHPDLESMKANTAVGFVLVGGALALADGRTARASAVLGALGLALGAATVLEYALGLELGIDELLVDDPATRPGGFPGRMGLNTALCFSALGAGRVAAVVGGAPGRRIERSLVLGSSTLAFLALSGYAFRVSSTVGLGSATEMALHTALAFTVLGLAGLTLATREGTFRLLVARGPGGLTARRTIPVVLGALLVSDLSVQLLETVGLLDSPELVLAYTATVSVVVVGVVLVAIGWRIERMEGDRLASEADARDALLALNAELADLNAELEDRVRERTVALDAANVDLVRSNRELEQFAYVASHDLKEPLRMVSSFVRRIEERYDDVLDERGRQYVHFAVDGAERMQALIDAVLRYSRVGRTRLEVVPVDLGEVADAVCGTLGARLEESGGSVEVGPLPTVRGDRALLELVLLNLVQNALKFTRDGEPPHVEISGGVVDAGPEAVAEIAVDDAGIGIAPEFRERVFEIFGRLNSRDRYEGTGIGLAIVQRVVERHDGEVLVGDSPLGGARLRVRLPVLGPAADTTTTDVGGLA